jgi:hypothetical protein
MCLLKAIHGLSQVFVVTFLIYNPEDPNLKDVYYITVRTASYITDFLNMVTLIYLFYSQAVASQKRSIMGPNFSELLPTDGSELMKDSLYQNKKKHASINGTFLNRSQAYLKI